MASKADVGKVLAATASLYEKALTPDAIQMLMMDLDGYEPNSVIAALGRCRRELRTFPTVSDILSRIDDGRPGAEAAWAMIPLSESDSVVWTAEMRDAYGQVRHLVNADPVAGRMAFREVYSKLLSQARADKAAIRWEPSLGHDPRKREQVLRDAVKLGRLTMAHVQNVMPQLEMQPPKRLALAGPAVENSDAQARIAEIRALIVKPMPKGDA